MPYVVIAVCDPDTVGAGGIQVNATLTTVGPTNATMCRVLVIEDDDELRAEIGDTLDQRGYEVIAARDGLDGLRLMRARCPDVIVFDLKMPRMNGWQFRVE